jgi:hypothetical protein
LSHLVPFWSRHSAPRIPGEGAARRQRQNADRSSPLGLDAVADGDAHRPGSCRSACSQLKRFAGAIRGHPGPKRQWRWGQMGPDGGVVLIVWWCSMFCVVPNRKLGKRRLNVFVVFPPKRNRNVVLQNCISMYFLVMGQSMVVNHSNFGLPWCCTVGWPSHLIHLNTWLVGMAGWLANGAALFSLG